MSRKRRIAFMGASGTGKTTLAQWVAQEYNLPKNPVGSRSVAQELGFESPYDVDAAGRRHEFQSLLLARKIQWEAEQDEFVTDRTTLDNLVYTAFHHIDTAVEQYRLSYSAFYRYTDVFFCPTASHLQIDKDPHRDSRVEYHLMTDVFLFGLVQQTNAVKTSVHFLRNPDIAMRKQAIRILCNG